MHKFVIGCKRLAAVCFLVAVACTGACAKSEIHVTVIPKAEPGGESLTHIEGTVSGVNPEDYWIVIYSRSDRGIWYVQPWENSPYTIIKDDKRWSAEIHPGMTYAALLVKKDSVCKDSSTDNGCFKPQAQSQGRPSVKTEIEVPGR